ncbi:hypothetical protein CANARDRAFT_7798 [[Candida] arabinofermentans NRRL YB-2248]|uniref:Uncharacterized protein n=1 Tax=[Candida] arabinofermentans NRRL YB-2248 TaxID=983967 RepID=A0A1E4T087_9ASCO|nr:hypothetical protein CANARDRAFT_7798 [[Candida] arabinofermentans NRRL YB-2248]
MVLHNDKWKTKSKKNYMRKHGLNKPQAGDHEQESIPTVGIVSDEDERETDDSEESDNDSTEDESPSQLPSRKKNLGKNDWRFKNDIESELPVPKDPFQIESDRLLYEEQKLLEKEQTDLVLNRIKNIDMESDWNTKKVKPKNLSNVSKADLLSWSESSNSVPKQSIITPKSNMRYLTEEEKVKFHEYENKIQRLKLLTSMKDKLSEKKPKLRTDNKVLELDLSKSSDDYQDKLESIFLDNSKKMRIEIQQQDEVDYGSFEDHLQNLLGATPTTNQDKSVDDKFDLESIIASSGNHNEESKNSRTTGRTVASTNVNLNVPVDKSDEDFFSELLG